MKVHLKKISLYDSWEQNTGKLCDIGKNANIFIENKYFSCDYLDFFYEKSRSVSDFKKMVSYRHQFWLNHPLRSVWLRKWVREINYFTTTSLQANNKLGLLKEFVWSKFSTLPLVISISNNLQEDHSKDIEKIIEAMDVAERALKKESTSSYDLLIIQRTRLPDDVVRKINKQRFLNIFQINLPKTNKNIFCEVIETWNFSKNHESIDICLPLSIGCVASCKMCEFSLFKVINIPPEALTQIIDYQARNNHNAPFANKPKYSFYYLGGGDALQYKALPSLLTYVSQTFNNPKQIISTIAFGTAVAFKSFLDKICSIPNVGLQWSLNTFDEANRQFITGCRSLMPVKTVVDLLKEYVEKSESKVTVSIMLFQEYCEDIECLKNNILVHLNPDIFKLNFANIQQNSLEFSKQKTQHIPIKDLYDWAIENNYEATIDSPPEEDNELAFCGRASNTVFNGNQPYLKEVKDEK